MSCFDKINEILLEETKTNSQYPLYLFEKENCQGKRYPPEGEFNLWEQYLTLQIIGFKNRLAGCFSYMIQIFVVIQYIFDFLSEGFMVKKV